MRYFDQDIVRTDDGDIDFLRGDFAIDAMVNSVFFSLEGEGS